LWSVPFLQPIPSLPGESGGHCALAFSPDGEWLAAGGLDGSVKLWSVHRQQAVEFDTQVGSIHGLSFSTDSQMLAVGVWRGGLKIFQVPTGALLGTIKHSGLCNSAVFSPDDKSIAALTDDSAVRIWDIANLKDARATVIFTGHQSEMCSIAFSPDGQLLATGSWDNAIRLTRPTAPPEKDVLRGHHDAVLSAVIAPDNRTIISGGADGTVWLWDAQSLQTLATLEAGRPGKDLIWSVSVSGDGKLLAAGGGEWTKAEVAGPLTIWDLPSRHRVARFEAPHGCLGSVHFGPDGKTLLCTGNDQIARAWDFVSNKVRTFKLSTEENSSRSALSSLSPDGRVLAIAGWRTGVKLLSASSGELLTTLTNGPQSYYSVRFSSDDQWLAAGRADGTAEIWNTRTWKPTSIANNVGAVWAFAFSPDGKALAIGSDDPIIQLWSLDTFERVGALEGHTAKVQALDFSQDGTMLISGGSDETVRIWRAPSFADIDRLRF
jgi:WD40 repeat protein